MRTTTVYLLHFNEPLSHARHYIGSAIKLSERLKEHAEGKGARITQVLIERGIGFVCVRTWKGNKQLERKLKNWHKARLLCPICKGENQYGEQ